MEPRKQYGLIAFLLMVTLSAAYAQSSKLTLGVWNLKSLTGSAIFQREYRMQENLQNSVVKRREESSVLSGEFLLKSKSFIWHPNFLSLEVDADYNPSSQRGRSLVVPERSEEITARKLRMDAVFFRRLPYSLRLFSNINSNLTNREFLSDVEMVKKDFGGGASLANRILPISFVYINSRTDQKELQTGRTFKDRSHDFRGAVNRSLFGIDESQLRFSYNQTARAYAASPKNRGEMVGISFGNDISSGEDRENGLNTTVSYDRQSGTARFKKLQVIERARVALPAHLRLSGSYQYLNSKQGQRTRRNQWTSQLRHNLFASLQSRFKFEFSSLGQTDYRESIGSQELGVDYQKMIPSGVLRLSYARRRGNERREYSSDSLWRTAREHVLEDNQVVLLADPFIDSASVAVTDATGIRIYQEDFDYRLVPRGNFLEIQRLSGGQIRDGAKVYVDYMVTQGGTYRYGTWGRNFGANSSLFGEFFNVYFRSSRQGFDDVERTDSGILRAVTHRLWGSRLSLGPLEGGAEFDEERSAILPNRSKQFHLSLAHQFFNRLGFAVKGDWREKRLPKEDERQESVAVFGRLIFRIGMASGLELGMNYQRQESRETRLEQTDLKGKFLTSYRNLHIKLGVDAYRQDLGEERIDFGSGYLNIERKF